MPTIVPGSCHLNEGCGWRDAAMPRNKGTNITTAGVAAPQSWGAFKKVPMAELVLVTLDRDSGQEYRANVSITGRIH